MTRSKANETTTELQTPHLSSNVSLSLFQCSFNHETGRGGVASQGNEQFREILALQISNKKDVPFFVKNDHSLPHTVILQLF